MSPRRIAGPCPVPGCPNRAGQCAKHQRQRERMRGSRQQRGYDKRHDRLRRDYQRRMDAGEAFVCWRPDCDRVIDPANWHLGHLDDRSGYGGPECVACNLRHGGQAAHRR